MTLNAWSKRIHENAVAHGWWENERTFAEVVSLFHSELSEALEEFRANRPMLYYPDTECAIAANVECAKPEGIAVELVDCVIRILDYLGHENIDIPNYDEKIGKLPSIYDTKAAIPEAVTNIHLMISQSYASHKFGDTNERNDGLFSAIRYIGAWLANNHINMEKIMLIKHEYNRTREYRHGGKAL